MTQRLIILLPARDDGEALWGLMDGEEIIGYDRDALPVYDGSVDVIVILPGQSVRLYPHELPATSKRDRLRAAGFSIEDKIAVPLSEVHIVLDDARIGVIDKADMQQALDMLTAANVKADKVYVDYDVLAGLEGSIAMQDRVVTAGTLGYTQDTQWVEAGSSYELSDEALLGAIGLRLDQAEPLNFLQNGFSSKSSLNIDWRSYVAVGVLMVCLGVAALALQLSETQALKKQTIDTKIRMTQLYEQATGKTAPSNPVLAATRAMQSAGKDKLAFLRLSKILFDGVAQIENLSVDQLRYQQNAAELQLRLIYPSFETAAELEAAIAAAGGVLTTGGVREQSGEFIGEATLRGSRS